MEAAAGEEAEDILEDLEEDNVDDVGPMQYVTAVRYRVTVKRLLREFVEECVALGIQPSEY